MLLFRGGDELTHRLDPGRRSDGQHVRLTGERHHFDEVLHCVESQVRIDRRVVRVRREVAKENGLPVDNITEVTVLDPYFYRP